MRKEADDKSGTLKSIAVSNTDVFLIAFWSILGGALCYHALSRVLPNLLGWPLGVARGIGFFFVFLSMFTPLKVWSQVKDKRMVGGVRFLLASAVAGIGFAFLDFLMP